MGVQVVPPSDDQSNETDTTVASADAATGTTPLTAAPAAGAVNATMGGSASAERGRPITPRATSSTKQARLTGEPPKSAWALMMRPGPPHGQADQASRRLILYTRRARS